jgi:hypothetical protein
MAGHVGDNTTVSLRKIFDEVVDYFLTTCQTMKDDNWFPSSYVGVLVSAILVVGFLCVQTKHIGVIISWFLSREQRLRKVVEK